MQVRAKLGTDLPGQDRCHEYATWVVTRGPTLRKALCSVSYSVVAALKFLIRFEQGAPHFPFTPSPANYVAGLASGCGEMVQTCDISRCWDAAAETLPAHSC